MFMSIEPLVCKFSFLNPAWYDGWWGFVIRWCISVQVTYLFGVWLHQIQSWLLGTKQQDFSSPVLVEASEPNTCPRNTGLWLGTAAPLCTRSSGLPGAVTGLLGTDATLGRHCGMALLNLEGSLQWCIVEMQVLGWHVQLLDGHLGNLPEPLRASWRQQGQPYVLLRAPQPLLPAEHPTQQPVILLLEDGGEERSLSAKSSFKFMGDS